MTATETLAVALDVGPLVGPPTGIGRFTHMLLDALDTRHDVRTIPYVLSFRATLPSGARRLRYPARAALAAWAHGSWPTARGALRGAQIVHGTNYVVPPTGWPTVVSVHDLTLFQRPELVLPVVRTFGVVIRRAVDRGAFVHTISHAVAAEVTQLLGTDRVRVVYPGPTFDPFLEASPIPTALQGRPYILAMGTREPRKNLPRLIAAFAQVHADNPEIHLVLAGSPGHDDAAIAAALAALSPAAAAQVVQLGFVHDTGRAGLFQHAAVFAYPSLDEGFGLPLLEAMFYGVPVVASTAGAIAEVSAGAALLVAATDVTGLAQALGLAISDSHLRGRLIERGRARYADFSWSKCADGMVGMYREALEASL
jgi:glycosyltransferase involved in cell wall biosynthesis